MEVAILRDDALVARILAMFSSGWLASRYVCECRWYVLISLTYFSLIKQRRNSRICTSRELPYILYCKVENPKTEDAGKAAHLQPPGCHSGHFQDPSTGEGTCGNHERNHLSKCGSPSSCCRVDRQRLARRRGPSVGGFADGDGGSFGP